MTSAFTRYRIFSLVLVGAVMFFVGAKFDRGYHSHIQNCDTDAMFVNPDIVCGEPEVIKKTGYIEMRNTILGHIDAYKEEHGVTGVSVYFRDMVRGPVMGINELDAFAPASLLKLPLAFVFFGASEDQPEVLSQKLNLQGTTSVANQRVKPRESAEIGRDYAIEELMRLMLTHSDNASYEVLEQFLQNTAGRTKIRHDTFQEIGLIDPRDRVETTISVRGYASLFRILYNASYLSPQHSEKVLSWLAESEYERGLVAGAPAGVNVAHKFGERYYENGRVELHDCGIIYFPGNPYLLCIMTRGSDFETLERLIGEISKMVYGGQFRRL